ncbi:MAG: CDP-glycerol glycerophosphotransferase family protein [Flavobacteriales bacterium]
MAVFAPRKAQRKFIEGTIAHLERQGVKVHWFTGPEFIGDYKAALSSRRVYPYHLCAHIPYRAILTPATHIPTNKYKHPQAQVIHVPHSMVSLHTIFTSATFIGFDHVFCCGPHHVKEIEAIFRQNGRAGRIARTGYEVIDRLAQLAPKEKNAGIRPCVLIAPTWGESSLLYRFGRELVDRLIKHYDVILRPHPWRIEQLSDLLSALKSDYASNPRFRYDDAVDSKGSMDTADLMISDYSGAAFEFALAYLRPVIFIDGPRKNAHLQFREILDEEGVEVRCRNVIGVVVQDLNELENAIPVSLDARGFWSDKLRKARSELLFNFGHCAEHATAEIIKVLDVGAVSEQRTT